MSNKHFIFGLSLFIILGFFGACHQSDPSPLDPGAKGDLYFSGYSWSFKSSTNPVGPGPNNFSSSSNNIWLDAADMLHLKISKDSSSSRWNCSELVTTKTFGYGTYVFTTASDLTTFNEKIVFGLFTWNNSSFQTQGNSEVDIEFARWNAPSDSLLLTYSVQPVWFSNPSPYIERTQKPQMQVSKLKGTCTHVFKWTPDLITWESYEGEGYPNNKLIASWHYDKNNIPRVKSEGANNSNPIVIPAPEESTNVRLNLWLLGGQAPSDGKEVEVVVKSFTFTPM